MADETNKTDDKKSDQKPADNSGADVEKLKATVARYESEAAQRAKADEDAKAAEKERLKKNGELEKLLEAQNADIAALKKKIEETGTDAQLGKSWREKESARIEAAKKDLTESQRSLLDKIPTLDAKADFLAEIATAKGSKTTANSGGKNAGSQAGAGHPGGGTSEVEAMIASGVSPIQIKAQHPDLWEAHIKSQVKANAQPAHGVAALFRKAG